MPEQPDLSDDDLRETLDLMATAVASMSDRVDYLTAVADKQIKVATEARIAAFAARDQTNPKNCGDLLGQTLNSHLGATADGMTEITRHLGVQTEKPSELWPNQKMTGSEPIERCSNGNRMRSVLKVVCIGCGPGADCDSSPFLGQQSFHVRCSRVILGQDNYGCRCLCFLSPMTVEAQPVISFSYDAVCYICVIICVTCSRMLPSILKINVSF